MNKNRKKKPPAKRLAYAIMLVMMMTASNMRAQEDLGPEELYQQGIQLFTGGKFAEALPFFTRLFDLFGNESEYARQMENVLYAMASAYYNTGQYAEANDTYLKFIERYPQAKTIDEVHFRSAAALQFQDKFEEAIATYQKLIANWPRSIFSEDAAYQIAICQMAADKMDAAVTAFQAFIDGYPQSEYVAQALVYLARAYFQAGDLIAALEAIERAGKETRSLDHLVYANFLAMEIGDAAFDETEYSLALRAFRRVRTSQSLINFQQSLVDKALATLAALQRQRVPPGELAAHFRIERRVRVSVDTLQQALEKLKTTGNYDATLFHRIGRCFFSIDRFWEARTAYERAVRDASDPVLQETAHFDLILALNRLRRFDELIASANAYLEVFGKDQKLIDAGRISAVAFMRAESYINMEMFEEAETEMAALQRDYPKHVQIPRIKFYLALSIAMQERFDEAISLFQTWLKEYPDHAMGAEVAYWLPVSMFYGGRYAEAIPLFDQYVQNYAMLVYAPEAAYRSALSKYSLEQFGEAAVELEAWLKKYPGHLFQWEARVTLGDAYAAEGMLEEAKQAYLGAITPEAGPMEYLALTQLNKVFKALDTPEDYRAMADTHIRFIKNNPDSGNMIESAYQAGWALRQLGRVDEARKLYLNCIGQFGNNKNWEGFAPMLKDLRGMYRDQPEGALDAEFRTLIEKARSDSRRTLVARLMSETFTWDESSPIDRARTMDKLFNLEVLDAEQLAFMGDTYIKSGDGARGQEILDFLLKEFPASRYLDVAFARKAGAQLAANDFEGALQSAEAAIQRANEPTLMMEAVYTKAQALRALGKFREAIEEYNMVLASRATPRPLKPKSMLEAAACFEALGEWNVAIPYYQRIYVMYAAYENEMAQAYLRSAVAFEKLNDYVAAMNTCREMLTLTSLAGRPELEEARALLARLEKRSGT